MDKPSPATPWLMLISRSFLFLAFQALLALTFLAFGHSDGWHRSAGWWVLAIIPANLITFYILRQVPHGEGKSW